MTLKLFYSYSHKDEKYREELEKHLKILQDRGLIDGWSDRKIAAGENLNQQIENNMKESHIILLLFSPDFISSEACAKEVKIALQLKNEKNTVFIPIILRECDWQESNGIADILALPKDAKPIKQWNDKDSAWSSVREGIKKQVEDIIRKLTPKLSISFKNELLKSSVTNCTLDRLFVYPDILNLNKSEQNLEKNEIDSVKLKEIKNFEHNYILIEGEEQSGKTSLCNMLYLHYVDTGLYPILLNGKEITGKADIQIIVKKKYQEQYESNTVDYDVLDKEKRILIIDDINENTAKRKNLSAFIKSIKDKFEYAIILIDELSNFSEKGEGYNYLFSFNDYRIKSLGHKKRDELIKKCIEDDENIEFSIESTKQIARLDKDTQHIDTIIGSNIVPSYPVFIISIFNIIESMNSPDMTKTSYGHCYHSMITMQLDRENVKADDMDKYFTFLTEFSYFLFQKSIKSASQDTLNNFLKEYKNEYIFDNKILDNLISSKIFISKDNTYFFGYVYIYYYFVAKYISDNFEDKKVELQLEKVFSCIYKKDHSNIIIFMTHHTKNKHLLKKILLNTISTFESFPEADLSKNELKCIGDTIKRLTEPKSPPEEHDPQEARNVELEIKDQIQSESEEIESELDDTDDNLAIDIRRTAKNIEIIGQIMKNQYGTFKKSSLNELFTAGQGAGLRLLKWFINLINSNKIDLENYFSEKLLQIKKNPNKISEKERNKLGEQVLTVLTYSVIFGCLNKIVSSLGYEKYIEIADAVNEEKNTAASKLINFHIHAWHKKNLDIGKLKSLYNDFYRDKNNFAIHILKNIVSHHIYMHKIDYKDKQKIDSLLGFDVQKQIAIQKK